MYSSRKEREKLQKQRDEPEARSTVEQEHVPSLKATFDPSVSRVIHLRSNGGFPSRSSPSNREILDFMQHSLLPSKGPAFLVNDSLHQDGFSLNRTSSAPHPVSVEPEPPVVPHFTTRRAESADPSMTLSGHRDWHNDGTRKPQREQERIKPQKSFYRNFIERTRVKMYEDEGQSMSSQTLGATATDTRSSRSYTRPFESPRAAAKVPERENSRGPDLLRRTSIRGSRSLERLKAFRFNRLSISATRSRHRIEEVYKQPETHSRDSSRSNMWRDSMIKLQPSSARSKTPDDLSASSYQPVTTTPIKVVPPPQHKREHSHVQTSGKASSDFMAESTRGDDVCLEQAEAYQYLGRRRHLLQHQNLSCLEEGGAVSISRMQDIHENLVVLNSEMDRLVAAMLEGQGRKTDLVQSLLVRQPVTAENISSDREQLQQQQNAQGSENGERNWYRMSYQSIMNFLDKTNALE